jgi:hypothetical protein
LLNDVIDILKSDNIDTEIVPNCIRLLANITKNAKRNFPIADNNLNNMINILFGYMSYDELDVILTCLIGLANLSDQDIDHNGICKLFIENGLCKQLITSENKNQFFILNCCQILGNVLSGNSTIVDVNYIIFNIFIIFLASFKEWYFRILL